MTNPFASKFGTLVLFAWEGQHPGTREPLPFIGLASPGDGTSLLPPRATMSALAAAIGMDPAVGAFTDSPSGLHVQLRHDGWLSVMHADQALAEAPSSPAFDTLALQAGRCALMIGYLPMPAGLSDDVYLDRLEATGQCVLALAPVTTRPA